MAGAKPQRGYSFYPIESPELQRDRLCPARVAIFSLAYAAPPKADNAASGQRLRRLVAGASHDHHNRPSGSAPARAAPARQLHHLLCPRSGHACAMPQPLIRGDWTRELRCSAAARRASVPRSRRYSDRRNSHRTILGVSGHALWPRSRRA
jgi:hypothetical protein